MDRQTAQTLIENTFNYPFNEDRFRNFTINLLNDVDESKAFSYLRGEYIKDSFKHHVKKYKRIGTYTDPEGDKADVLVVHLSNPWALERSRTMLRNFAAWYLKNRDEKDAALIGYYTDDPDDWRFSFVKMEYRQEVTDTGRVKVKEELTSARRYSYLVGKNEPNHTAQAQLIPILKNDQKNPSLMDIEDAFSVDAVTKQFYKDYRTLFEKLTDELNDILKKDKKIKKEFKDKTIDTGNFAKKLMGQVVFLYFLQKKGWLGVGRDEQGNYQQWGTGPKNFLRRLFEKEYTNYQNFFNDVLEPLFYEALAWERPNDFYSRFNCKIPFLNGGLFEPINDYSWDETDICIDNDIFSEILDTFGRYNFTVKEDDPLDKEVAVDPEMLGKVFENLLPENIRKGKGAYYTPRTIVHYMCQESLINYLATECESSVLKEDIETFIRKGESAVEFELAEEKGTKSYKHQVPDSIRKNAKMIDEKLAEIKVCDPAIGSGAFSVGIMNEIVKARMVLDIYLKKKKTVYDVKRHCIQHSLYGVDIDPGAIDIAKLRLWLSLVVDEEDYHTIKPLPNLDFKIMQGNSLIEEFYGISLNIEKKKGQITLDLGSNIPELDRLIEKLHQKQAVFFNATHPNEKQKRKQDVEQTILKIFNHQLKHTKKFDPEKGQVIEKELNEMTHGNKIRNFFPWKLYFADIFRKKGGFDVVTANPPYIGEKGNKLIFQPVKKSCLGTRFHRGRMDLFYYFFHLSLDINKLNGTSVFISTNYYTTSHGGKLLRKDLKERSTIRRLIDFNEFKIFESAIGQHNMISIFSKGINPLVKTKNSIVNLKGVATAKILENIFQAEYNNTEHFQIGQDDLYEENEYYVRLRGIDEKSELNNILKKIKEGNILLGKVCNINNGLRSGIDKISSNGIKKGVFVLDKNEKKFSERIVKEYFKNSDIYKYQTNNASNKYIIYSTKKTDIKKYPKTYNHLLKFKRKILEKRWKESVPWFSLVRPRNETIFKSEKIVSPQRSLTNMFGYNSQNWYAGSDVFFITLKSDCMNIILMKYLLALLNSKLYYLWLFHKGKKKGDYLELIGTPLKEIPIKLIPVKHQKSFAKIITKILSAKQSNSQNNTSKLESIIDRMVYKLYNLTEEEVAIVEEKYRIK